MYETLIVTPEFEYYAIDSNNNETCPVFVEMKLWTKEWVSERIMYTNNPLGKRSINIEGAFQEAGHKEQRTIINPSILADKEILQEVRQKVFEELDKEIHANSLIPLKEFICDSCGKKIHVNEFPAIEYFEDAEIGEIGIETTIKGLRIIHNQEDCSYSVEEKGYVVTMPIDNESLGRNQIAMLIALQEESKVDRHSFGELLKRLTIPYYEESRKYMPEIETTMNSLNWTIHKYNRHVLRDIVLNK
ncbi:MAG: hypothetical protein KBT36_14430 [Kurthia sp.]|nr:hypothetical protein [Candidatus Kurthia equi]